MSDDRFGIVVSARDAWANADELRALGARYVRTVVYDFDQLDAVLRDHPPEVPVIAVLDTRFPGVGRDLTDLAGWDLAVWELAERFAGRIAALECLSTWDVLDVEAADAVACARSAGRILRDTDSGIACLLGAVAGPRWMARLHEVARLLTPADRDLLAGVCFHPHRKNARGFPGFDHSRFEHGEIDVAVQDAHDIVQLPIWVTELGVRLGQAGGETGQARYLGHALELLAALPRDVLAAAIYRAWWDPVGAPHERGDHAFGLRREDAFDAALDGTPRRAWYAFAESAGGTSVPPAVFSAPRALATRCGRSG
jgi:hypothetical protein